MLPMSEDQGGGMASQVFRGFLAHGWRALREGDAVAAEGFFRMILVHNPEHAGAVAGLQATLGQDPMRRSEGAVVGITWLLRGPRQAGSG